MSVVRPEAGPAIFSSDRVYRYTLTRVKPNSGPDARLLMWVGLNPSTADEQVLDPTLRRVWRYSLDWGYDGFVMTNLFAFRATFPSDMKAQSDPVGPDNDHWLQAYARRSEQVICAWGAHGVHLNRSQVVTDALTEIGCFPKLRCLVIVANGEPGHPLRLNAALRPKPYPPR